MSTANTLRPTGHTVQRGDDPVFPWSVMFRGAEYDAYTTREAALETAHRLNAECGNPEEHTHTEHTLDTCQ